MSSNVSKESTNFESTIKRTLQENVVKFEERKKTYRNDTRRVWDALGLKERRF